MYPGEKLNSITHLVGAALALVGLGALLTVSIQERDPYLISSFTIFGGTLVLLYTMSTLYHSFHPPRLKKVFQKLDHVSIYLLIAGTYTPYMLVTLREHGGLLMLSLIWVMAIIGVLMDTLLKKRNELLQVSIYLIMGWVCTLHIGDLNMLLGHSGLIWLSGGGVLYTIGIVFYILDNLQKLPYAHGIWHIFVLSGSVCHFVSIAAYVR